MKKAQQDFTYDVYDDINELDEGDRQLLTLARQATGDAYVPYSHFNVGAAALLENEAIVKGSNQENASYPVGLCAERVLLSGVSSLHPGVPVKTIAISYNNQNGSSDKPVSPCGICRQTLVEYEQRFKEPIRLILAGMEGKIFVIERAGSLLPLGFTASDFI